MNKGMDLLSIHELSAADVEEILTLAADLKAKQKAGIPHKLLAGKTLGMIFEKSSTRTRVSFEVGMYQLGGQALFLSSRDLQLGRGEPIKDTARVLSRYLDGIMIRTYGHERIEELAHYADIPVINALSNLLHPCQALTDLLTIREYKGKNLAGLKMAYVGDGNNMTHSWLMLASKLGLELRVATPKGYEVDAEILKMANENAKISGAKIFITNDIKETVDGADVVTTDTWVSMGQEAEKEKRLKDFAGYCVDENLMSLAKKDAIFLHCLPAYRGYEVSEAVFERHADEIFIEAENRLHAQKGVMVWLDERRR